MQETEIIDWVEKCINEVEDKFCKNHYYFIDGMEDDILAYLYHLITREEYFNKEINYEFEEGNSGKTKVISVQARTFEKVNSKTGRFDLAILDISPNAEHDNLLVIELKWVGALTDNTLERIKEDIDKINNKGNDVKRGYLLIFNSRRKFTEEFKNKIIDYNKNPLLKIKFINSKP